MPQYTTRGLRLNYEVVGVGRPLVLLHGLSNFALSWAPQLGGLVARGWQVVLPDLAGHGRSAPVTRATTTQDLAADVLTLCDHLGLDRAALCGLSLGGMVAQQLLVDHPERVAGVVVVAAGPHLAVPGAEAMIASWNELWRSENGPVRRLEATWPLLTTAPYRSSPHGQAFYEAWRQVLTGVSGPALAHVATGLLAFNVAAALPHVAVPLLAVAGEQDRLAPPAMVRAVADVVSTARFVAIPEAGHLVNLEQPATFNTLLHEFLAGLSDSDS